MCSLVDVTGSLTCNGNETKGEELEVIDVSSQTFDLELTTTGVLLTFDTLSCTDEMDTSTGVLNGDVPCHDSNSGKNDGLYGIDNEGCGW